MIKKILEAYDKTILDLSPKNFLRNVNIYEDIDKVLIELNLGFPLNPSRINYITSQLSNFLKSKNLGKKINLNVSCKILTHKVQSDLKPIPGIKNIIAIASGKGGVGKSTITSNLAICLRNMGAKVGILDADIYGPSQPLIMGSFDNPFTNDKKKIEPIFCHGVKLMSIGNLISQDSAIIWRGPMVSTALMQLLHDTHWGELDYLFIDLPPGTGDVQLTLTKSIPLTSAVIVTTPQDLSLIDARRAISMFNKLDIPLLGVIENMSMYTCQNCGLESAIFGAQGAKELCNKDLHLSLLGTLPIHIKIREDADKGKPSATEKGWISEAYEQIALRLSSNASMLPKAIVVNFPKVKIEYN